MNTTTIVSYNDFIEEVRKDVFTMEQNIPENIEIDDLDPKAKHAIASNNKKAIGTGRILFDDHIGRVAIKRDYRGKCVGEIIIKKLIDAAKDLDLAEVWLPSQCHTKQFYQKLGFKEFGDIYQEAGINHIKMKKNYNIEACGLRYALP